MGDAHGLADEAPHEVYVDSFYMDVSPITQRHYERITGKNPSKRQQATHPVERMQWAEAARFCNLCSELEGLTTCYDLETWECDFSADGYRLPTEAEWEYACRAGNQTSYHFGNEERDLTKYAWCKPHSKGRTWPVAQKLPNSWGLYDMHGNVWEWCNDYYNDTYYDQSPRENPRGPTSGNKRVLRGGAWNSTAEMCRAASRFSEFQVFTDACFGADSYGFRRVRKGVSPTDLAPRVAQAADAVGNRPTVSDERAAVEAPEPRAVESPAPAVDRLIDRSRIRGTIVFVSDRGKSFDIWKMNADGEGLQQLTQDDYPDADPRHSPQGDRILYTSLREGFPQVWIMGSDGSDPKQITNGSQAQWSPDGNAIVFVRDDQVYVRQLETKKEERVTPGEWRRCGVPTWSPDGKQIAVASRHQEQIGIFLLSTDGAEIKPLVTAEPSCTPHWSTDGSMVSFQTDKGHVHVLYTEDGTEEQVTFGADIQHDARFSPDGSMIVFARAPTESGPWQIWITDLESDDLDSIQITHEGSNRLPDWYLGR